MKTRSTEGYIIPSGSAPVRSYSYLKRRIQCLIVSWYARECNGMKVNDEVEFEEANILCCYRKGKAIRIHLA